MPLFLLYFYSGDRIFNWSLLFSDWLFFTSSGSWHEFPFQVYRSEFSWSRSLVLSFKWVGHVEKPYRCMDKSSQAGGLGRPTLAIMRRFHPEVECFAVDSSLWFCLRGCCWEPWLLSDFFAIRQHAPGQTFVFGRTCSFPRTPWGRPAPYTYVYYLALTLSLLFFPQRFLKISVSDAAFPGVGEKDACPQFLSPPSEPRGW